MKVLEVKEIFGHVSQLVGKEGNFISLKVTVVCLQTFFTNHDC
jgi:hypothetical protein